ncbi:hypothetical protein GS3922_07685 [Geobacillus subterraneus]|uniref:Aldehyde dehydrogenase domain-containing protein n=1 Tax=Geobacillus subterraneus TaxID=129338 RepID=A0ABM6ABA5_9BACL|nr:hypothetical protein GS3922_07685 [Geobacillus subterraneus]KZS25009.1 hypothetical protein A5418_12045 [Geobacillus subterraneus]
MTSFEQWNRSFINGEWTEGKSGRTYDNINPFDGSLIASIRLATKEQLADAFLTAEQAQKEWAKTPAATKKAVLRKAADYLRAHRSEIVDLIARETGGSMIKANVELDLSIGLVEEAVQMVDELTKVKELPSEIEGKINRVYRLPLGVITSISPFNFPQ